MLEIVHDHTFPDFIAPHDDLSALKAANRRVISPLLLVQQEIKLGYEWGKNLIVRKRVGETQDIKERLYRIFNGEVGAEVLQDKFLFGNLVRELGYLAPQSVLVTPGEQREELVGEVAALNNDDPRRFCKPLGGTCGKGTYVATNAEDAVSFARNQSGEYLIQTFEEEKQDWRYILHRDNSQLQSGTSPRWRIGYERFRPKVVGNGSASIAEIVQQDETIPDYAKHKYFKYQRRNESSNMHTVPAAGEIIEICDSGNLAKGAYIRMPGDNELNSMDRFMLRFSQDLEENLGSPINTLAVDLGVKDPCILEEPYDFEKMRDNIVFYEFQVPFGYGAYAQIAPNQEDQRGLSRILPEGLYRNLRGRDLWYSFLKSLLVSGALNQRTDNSQINSSL